MNQTTQQQDSNKALYVAFELSKKRWKLAIGDGSARPPRVVSVAAGDFEGLASRASTETLRRGRGGTGAQLLRGGARRLLD